MTSSMMPRSIRNLCVTLAVAVGVAVIATSIEAATPATPAAATIPAAQSPPTTVDIEKLENLDEVVVRGKHLVQQIEEAEDEFFSLFNDVNKDDRYDTHCVYLQLDSESRLQHRVCMPGFVADAMADWAPYKARCQPPVEGGLEFYCLDKNKDNRISRNEASARFELEAQFMSLDTDQDNYLSLEEFPTDMAPPTALYMPPPPDLVLAEGSKRWYEHMLKVTDSDPRLHKMADHLGDLYHELSLTKQQYGKLEAEAKPKKVDLSKAGPRAR